MELIIRGILDYRSERIIPQKDRIYYQAKE